MAIVGEVDESVSSRGCSRSGPARVWGWDGLWSVWWAVVAAAVSSVMEWFAVWPERGRTVFPRASLTGDAE